MKWPAWTIKERAVPVWAWNIHVDGRYRFYHAWAKSEWQTNALAADVYWPHFENVPTPVRWQLIWYGVMVEKRALWFWVVERRFRWTGESDVGKIWR